MKRVAVSLPVFGILISISVLVLSSVASAHVVVRPAEVVSAGFQTFTVGVPNEKDIPTTSVKLLIPEGLKHVSPTQKTGWDIAIEKEGEGESARVASITWGGGSIGEEFRDDFTFSAQAPEQETTLQWKAYQTYADGTVVSWDKADSGHGHDSQNPNEGPFSVTEVVSETAASQAIQKADQAAADAQLTAQRALYIAIAGLALALLSLTLATRKNDSR